MWHHLIPANRPENEQIRAITNGVHHPSWLGIELQELFASWFGERWPQVVTSPEGREAILAAPDGPLWEVHLAQKRHLARFLRSRLRDQFARHGLSPGELRKLEHTFDPEVLTIGFARRFATYKRAGLLFSDLHRLRKLVGDAERPLQILLAGKAHPADKAGQELIQHIFQLSQSEALKGKVFFVEDYDMRVGRMLVQGVDVWLNTPRRPLEASGTSGMKAAMNGALNCSIADGWWPEGYDGENGWVIGSAAEDPTRDTSAGKEPMADEAKTRPRGRPGALRPARGADRADLLRPQRGRASGRMAAADEGGDRHHHAEVRQRPHGARLRRARLREPARGR